MYLSLLSPGSAHSAAILNAAEEGGRILPNTLSDRIGVSMLCLLAVHDAAGMVVEAAVAGFFSGVAVALPPVGFRVLMGNPSMVGTRIRQGFAIGGAGTVGWGAQCGCYPGEW
ncbi:hypothetical protein BJX61DRAFT_545606 [Aspergillus egyptiacus]|nr:hypothetical protein BJX61DRAFT_545606 [Aspergillus egyptiacus]